MSKYNGWTNYETWNVALWIDNEPHIHDYWRAEAAEAAKSQELAAFTLAHRLKDEFAESAPTLEDCYGDLLLGALSQVNWLELAEHLLED